MTIGLNDKENGHIGVNVIHLTSLYLNYNLFYTEIIGPPALKLYAVLPAGVEIIKPSP